MKIVLTYEWEKNFIQKRNFNKYFFIHEIVILYYANRNMKFQSY